MRVRVLFDYAPQDTDELALVQGDTLEIKDAPSDGWWYAVAADGRSGLVPHNYVKRLLPPPPPGPPPQLRERDDGAAAASSSRSRSWGGGPGGGGGRRRFT